MARAIWTGSISFGLVTIPVGLFSATEDHTIHFHQFERGTGDRIRNHRMNERTGAEIDYSDIVKGTEVGDGEYVQVETDELDSVAPGRSRSLELTDFVALEEIDPIYLNRTYWLAPTNEQYAKPYRLLRDAMERTGRAGIGRFVMRGKEYLIAIRPHRQVLALETLFFADEVRDPAEELDNLPGKHTESGKELDMATQLIESMASAWRPSNYHDTYRDRVAQLIEDKHQGREVVAESEPATGTEMSELVDALERSVSSARSGSVSGSGSAGRRAGGQRRPADLAGASKTELTKMARELEVAGRSSMTADELAEAIDKARKDAPKARRAS